MFGYSFYRNFDYKMVTHARVFCLQPKFIINNKQGLFLVNSFNFLRKRYGYENMCSWTKIKKEKIQLPIKNGEIDFEFMEFFIEKMESQHIAWLKAYLNIAGLKDYNLTLEEEKVLKEYKNLNFKNFNITDIFEIKNTRNVLSQDIVPDSGKTPYLCASSENNGVSSYITYKKEFLEKGNCIFIGGKTFVVSYQEKDFYSNDSHNLALYLKNEEITKYNQLYLATCINKSLRHKYFWGDSISKSKIEKEVVLLPEKNNVPDFSQMKILISAIQKLIIKDLILYIDNKLKDTRKINEK